MTESNNEILLARIADALDRLSPPTPAEADAMAHPAYRWDGHRLLAVLRPNALPLDRFAGVDSQLAAIRQNLAALQANAAAHDMLLWGSRGMGKSALVRSVSAERGVALVQCAGDVLATLPALFDRLRGQSRPYVIFVDDLAFAATDPGVRLLRSLLDGGVAERPANLRLAVTSNHRHLVEREQTESSRHGRDSQDDQLALVDRFGLVLGFHAPDQDTYLEMVRRHLSAEGLEMDAGDALQFALGRGGRSGRTAWHYRTECLSRRAST